jgi:hypothetical protein
VVTAEEEFLTFFNAERPGEALNSAAAVAAHLARRFHSRDDRGQGFGSRDMAVWEGGRLVATVVKGPDGEPVVDVLDPST